ncbi:MAG: hypothetical protein R3F60_05670 [bacterium]
MRTARWLLAGLTWAMPAAADLQIAAPAEPALLLIRCDDPAARLEVVDEAVGEPVGGGLPPLKVALPPGPYRVVARCTLGPPVEVAIDLDDDTEQTLRCPARQPPTVPERRYAMPHAPALTASPDWTAGGVMAGVGGGHADAAAVSWALGFDGPAPRWGGLFWSTARFRVVMSALGPNEVLLAPTFSSLGGLAVRVPGGEIQVAAGPIGGLLILEDHDDRPGFVDGVAGGGLDLGFSHPLSVGQRDLVALWFGLEGAGLYAVDQARTIWTGLAAFRFEFLVHGR